MVNVPFVVHPRRVHEACCWIEPRQPVPRTGDNPQKLRERDEGVEELGDEEEHEGLAEVPEDGGDGEGDAGEVGEGIPDEHAAWLPLKNMC